VVITASGVLPLEVKWRRKPSGHPRAKVLSRDVIPAFLATLEL